MCSKMPDLLLGLAGLMLATIAAAVPPGQDDLWPAASPSDYQSRSALPCQSGMAGDFHCHGIDLLSYVSLGDMGCTGNGNDLWGWTDPQTGVEYALMGCNNGTAFLELSDPENPLHLGNLPTQTVNSLWRDIKVYADHAYIVSEASGHGLQVFDLTRLRGHSQRPVEFSPTVHLASFGKAHNIAINKDSGFAYVVGSGQCGGGLHIIDIRRPASPQVAGCFSADGYTHDTQCVIYHGPHRQYQGREICFNSNVNTLTIVDVTDKSAPVQLARESYDGVRYVHQGWLTKDHRHFLLGDELDERHFEHNTRTRIWDVTDLTAPFISGIFDSTEDAIDHNLYVHGKFVYQSNYTAGLRILDLAEVDQGMLSEVAYFNVIPHQHHELRHEGGPGFSGTWSNYPFFDSGIVIVSTMGVDGEPGGLFVVRPYLEPSLITGQVFRSDNHQPLEGSQIELAAGLPHAGVSEADGSYAIEILPGTYDLTVSLDGYTTALIEQVVVAEGAPALVDVALDPPPGVLGLAADQLAFDNITVGESASAILEISHQGGRIISIESISEPLLPFSLDRSDCSLDSFVLDIDESCSLVIGFQPDKALAFSAELIIHHDAPGSPATISISGSGRSPLLYDDRFELIDTAP
jgi:choice-of-anchor B domain-containing protein